MILRSIRKQGFRLLDYLQTLRQKNPHILKHLKINFRLNFNLAYLKNNISYLLCHRRMKIKVLTSTSKLILTQNIFCLERQKKTMMLIAKEIREQFQYHQPYQLHDSYTLI